MKAAPIVELGPPDLNIFDEFFLLKKWLDDYCDEHPEDPICWEEPDNDEDPDTDGEDDECSEQIEVPEELIRARGQGIHERSGLPQQIEVPEELIRALVVLHVSEAPPPKKFVQDSLNARYRGYDDASRGP